MKQLSLRELQLLEFDLLKVFKALCDTNGLYYTLAGGTLLGAVRHGGFIPWDDDIDVMMPRPDFERLLRKNKLDISMFPKHVFIESWLDGGYSPYIKMRDARTFVENKYSHGEDKVWIDIFPVDGCPDDDKELDALFKKALRQRKLLVLKNAKLGEGTTLAKKIMKPFALLAMAPFSRRRICSAYDRYVQSYSFEECNQVGGVCWGYGPGERIDKEKYLTPIELEFEGELFKCPSNYDQYLTGLYGKYMQLPPPEERGTRHDIKVYYIGYKRKI